MKGHKKLLDAIDRSILRLLSLHQSLNLLELWYELGEDNAVKECVTKEELLSRLESLMAQGFVEQTMEARGDIRWTCMNGKVAQ